MNRNDLKLKSWLIFKLKNELFGINVSNIISILDMQHITELPQSPDYLKGVINLRGSVLPLISMRLKFGMEDVDDLQSLKILVLEIIIGSQHIKIGVIVDFVESVIEIENKDIQDTPTIGTKYKSEFIYGMVQKDEEFIMLLNIDRVFSSDDIVELEKIENDK